MDRRRGRGRPRGNREPSPDVPIEPAADRAEVGLEEPNRNQELDDRLIAAYERGRQAAERRNVGPEAPVAQGDGPENFRKLYDSFMRLNPPQFDGTGGYSDAEEWLEKINAKLVLCRAPVDDMVELAEQQLDGDARFWWNGARRNYVGEAIKIPWEWFEQQFIRRFLSNIHREALRRKFLELTQGGRSVAEYNNEFLALSRYATDVQNDRARYHRQYLDGLNGNISMIVDTPMATELQAMMDHAEQVEMHAKRRKEQFADRNVKQRADQSRPVVRSRGGSSSVRPPQRQVFTPRPSYGPAATSGFRPAFQPSSAPMWCRSCNQAHDERECRRRNGVCYLCGSGAHWANECSNFIRRFPRDSGAGESASMGRGGPSLRGRGGSQVSGGNISRAGSTNTNGRTGGRVAVHALDVAGDVPSTSDVAPEGEEDIGYQTDVMTGIISISDHDTYCLIDTGCSHSIVSRALVESCQWPVETNNQMLKVQTPFSSTNQTIMIC